MLRTLASRISIKVSLPALISLLVLFTVTTLSVIAYRRGHAVASNLALQNLTQVHERIRDRLEDYFGIAERINRIDLEIISAGRLNRGDLAAWRTQLYEQIRAFETISSIIWGDAGGGAVFVSRYPGRRGYRFGLATASSGEAQQFEMGEGGRIGAPEGHYSYDPRVRPWYRDAVAAGRPVWADIYTWVIRPHSAPVLSIPYVAPLQNEGGSLEGVMDVEFSLYDIGRFLQSLSIGKTGSAYIMDREGLLVATSNNTPAMNSSSGSRYRATQSSNAFIAASARALAAATHSTFTSPFHDTLDINGDRVLMMASRFRRPGNLDWQIVTLVPENDFLESIKAGRIHDSVIAAFAVALAILLGIGIAMYLARPIVSLSEHARRLGRGDLDAEIHLSQFPEFVRLSASVNRMAEGLRERLRLRESLALAMEVQQRLLPPDTPRVQMLDISGYSAYCDETGGDYYDYLSLGETGDPSLVVAIGDVSGHGIASAMVMAEARGILRSRTYDVSSLGSLLDHMNRQIYEDSSRGRFMTMLLLGINPARSSLRWASAGHRPPMVYDPVSDHFEDLSGGDVPLGVVEMVGYREFEYSKLRPGHIILVATDGLWEAPNPEGAPFGMEGIREVVRNSAAGSAAEIEKGLVDAVNRFRNGAAQTDDITFVVVKVTA